MGAMLSLFTFLVPSSKLVPIIYFGQRVAQVTVRRREIPAVLPSDDDHISLNEKSKPDPQTNGSEKLSQMSLKELVEERVPSLHRPFRPSWWLPNGHFQTGYTVVANFDSIDQVIYKRTLLRLPDGGTLGLDFTPVAPARDQDETAPVIVVMHGLTGGSQEPYVRSILATACLPKEQGGLGARAVVVNFRGCAGVPLTSPQFYNGGNTDDLRTALLYISAVYPRAPLLGIGFSLGANVLTRYMGEEGSKARLRAGCVLACPWDFVKNSAKLEDRWLNRTIYSRALGRNLTRLFKRHQAAIESFGPSLLLEKMPKAMELKKPQLKDIDHNVTIYCAGDYPWTPFDSADTYYKWGGGHWKLPGIEVPFLAINSVDDPIVAEIPYEIAAKNPWVCLVTTKFGGHIGWFEGPLFGRKGKPPHRWMKKPVIEWFAAVLDITDNLGATGISQGNPRETKDGFEREIGHRWVGYRVLETGIKIHASKSDLLQGL
ncbi:hypothetical protein FRB95_006287 [Tulasnella sp. JGI-2019a]|nr:hypothetical protein FRB95_006287 [Tulasnella sp. JGI-2019a]